MGQDKNIEEANSRMKAFTIEDDEQIVQDWIQKIEASISSDIYEKNNEQLEQAIEEAQANIFARATNSCEQGNKIKAQNILENYSEEIIKFSINNAGKKLDIDLCLETISDSIDIMKNLDLQKANIKSIETIYKMARSVKNSQEYNKDKDFRSQELEKRRNNVLSPVLGVRSF